MKFSAKEDIEAPIEAVFDMVSDFEGIERSALRRGAEVQRVDAMRASGVGMEWDVAFMMRGRRREVRLTLSGFEPPNSIRVDATSTGMTGHFAVDLLALSRTRTRMSVELELKPQNLSSRLLIQSLKLAKTNLTKRFKLRVAEYVRTMEDRLGSAA